jgi:hypothetical protein
MFHTISPTIVALTVFWVSTGAVHAEACLSPRAADGAAQGPAAQCLEQRLTDELSALERSIREKADDLFEAGKSAFAAGLRTMQEREAARRRREHDQPPVAGSI